MLFSTDFVQFVIAPAPIKPERVNNRAAFCGSSMPTNVTHHINPSPCPALLALHPPATQNVRPGLGEKPHE
jgi:hypothetical protein